MKLAVNVEQDDIDNGIPCNGYNCPIAKAASRVVPEEWFVVAVPSDLFFVHKGRKVLGFTVYTPVIASQWMRRFDTTVLTGDQPGPFSFEIELDNDQATRLGIINQERKHRGH